MNRTAFIVTAFALLATASGVLAAHVKRDVPPIVIDGVRFIVPNDNGCQGYVRAVDAETGKTLWEKTIYRVWLWFPLPEGDVWWVLIKQMRAKDGTLFILSERDKWYSLDPKTRKVKRVGAKEAGEDTGQPPPGN